MEREIKFRGKRLDNGEWVVGDLIHKNNGDVAIRTYLNVWVDNSDDIDAYGEEFIINPATVGQYTGLKDKNGKEIYEGDLFHAGYFGGNDVVLWNKENARYIGKTPHGYISYVGREPSAEIVGNIHDHPELLKQN